MGIRSLLQSLTSRRNREPTTASFCRYLVPLLVLLYAGFVGQLWGQTPYPLSRYVHSGWGPKEAAPRVVRSIAQTPDGFLWFASLDGLFRFDGIRFEAFASLQGDPLPRGYPTALYVDPAGNLWVGYLGGAIVRITKGQVKVFATAAQELKGNFTGFAMDGNGTMWAASNVGLMRLEQNYWAIRNGECGVPAGTVTSLYSELTGGVWLSTPTTIYFKAPGTNRFVKRSEGLHTAFFVTSDLNGQPWVADVTQSVHPVFETRTDPHPSKSENGAVAVGSQSFLFDTDRSLWITTLGDGVRRVRYPERLTAKMKSTDSQLEKFGTNEGLTNNYAISIFKDREGAIWIGTLSGVDRFQLTNIVPVKMPRSLSWVQLQRDVEGNVWLLSMAHVYRIDPVTLEFIGTIIGKRETNVTQIINHRDGSMWAASPDGIRYVGSRGGYWIEPPPHFDHAFTILEDDQERLYAYIHYFGLFRYENAVWHQVGADIVPPKASQSSWSRGNHGDAYFGFDNGSILEFDNGILRLLLPPGYGKLGRIAAIGSSGQHVWFAGNHQIGLIEDEKSVHIFPHLFASGRVVFLNEGQNGDLWCVEESRVTRVPEEAWRQTLNNGSDSWNRFFYSVPDFLPSWAQTAAFDRLGRLWVAAADGLVYIDSTQNIQNTVIPPVSVTSITVNDKKFLPDGAVLPALSKNISVQFAALSLRDPARNIVRYKLEGIDTNWQTSGMRRDAYYTNLAPGSYTFHVIASNDNGVWNDIGSTIHFKIIPAWYQRPWFLLICVVIVIGLVWSLYLLRIRILTSKMVKKFDTRLAERTRVARDLHDTFLQTVQASRIVAYQAKDSPHQNEKDEALVNLSTWLEQAVEEGRQALQALRASSDESDSIAETVLKAADKELLLSDLRPVVTVSGEPRMLQPIIRDEICHIATEALRNAAKHSRATTVTIQISYDHEFSVAIADNGIGMPAGDASHAIRGHYGIKGMRERAAQLRAKLTTHPNRGGGTIVRLMIPGSIVYRKPSLERGSKRSK